MIKEIHIDTFEDLMQIFSAEQYQEDINRYRSSYLYRGMQKSTYKMTTSLQRNCKHLKKALELEMLKNFTKYAIINDPSITNSVWRQMVEGQHHGLPTRLLDFTHSPLIALHFAAVDDIYHTENDDCLVWRIDMAELHNLLPERYKAPISGSHTKIYSMNLLDKIVASIDQYDNDMGSDSMLIVEPSSIDDRIVNQYSFFAIVPDGVTDIEEFLNTNTDNTIKYVINHNLKWRIADTLDAFNISERIIYPGLDGLSAWIKRHYYVRNPEE